MPVQPEAPERCSTESIGVSCNVTCSNLNDRYQRVRWRIDILGSALVMAVAADAIKELRNEIADWRSRATRDAISVR